MIKFAFLQSTDFISINNTRLKISMFHCTGLTYRVQMMFCSILLLFSKKKNFMQKMGSTLLYCIVGFFIRAILQQEKSKGISLPGQHYEF